MELIHALDIVKYYVVFDIYIIDYSAIESLVTKKQAQKC